MAAIALSTVWPHGEKLTTRRKIMTSSKGTGTGLQDRIEHLRADGELNEAELEHVSGGNEFTIRPVLRGFIINW